MFSIYKIQFAGSDTSPSTIYDSTLKEGDIILKSYADWGSYIEELTPTLYGSVVQTDGQLSKTSGGYTVGATVNLVLVRLC